MYNYESEERDFWGGGGGGGGGVNVLCKHEMEVQDLHDIQASFSFFKLLTYNSTPPPASTRNANEVQEIG